MTIILGKNSTIHSNVSVDSNVNVIMGDCSSIGQDVVISGEGTLRIGDYVKVHRLCWLNVFSDIDVGHNSWIGEKSIIDGTARLKIENNVLIGAASQVWTHVAGGDAFSGCRIRCSKSITIENNAWLCAGVLLQASNVSSRVVVFAGSNVTSDICAANTIWSGNPAIDITNVSGGKPWVDVTVEQKLQKFDLLLKMYEREVCKNYHRKFVAVSDLCDKIDQQDDVTYFSMHDCTYVKTQSDDEQSFMKWLLRQNKAKFTPVIL